MRRWRIKISRARFLPTPEEQREIDERWAAEQWERIKNAKPCDLPKEWTSYEPRAELLGRHARSLDEREREERESAEAEKLARVVSEYWHANKRVPEWALPPKKGKRKSFLRTSDLDEALSQ